MASGQIKYKYILKKTKKKSIYKQLQLKLMKLECLTLYKTTLLYGTISVYLLLFLLFTTRVLFAITCVGFTHEDVHVSARVPTLF